MSYLKKKISRLKWEQMCAGIENQQILANAEKMLSEENYEGISSSSDTVQMMTKITNHIQRRKIRNQRKVLTKTPKKEEFAVKESGS